MLKQILLAGALALASTTAFSGAAFADCAFENKTPVKSLSAGFEAWKAMTDAAAECGNFEAELDQEFRTKQPEAFNADPALYNIGGVSNGTIVPLLNAGTVRELDDLVEKYGEGLTPNQLIKVDGKTVAVAMMVNAQHLMYREDVLQELGIEVPKTWDEVIAAAQKIKESGKMEYPLGATMKSGWNLAQEFNNMFLGMGGQFVNDKNEPTINTEAGVKALEKLKELTQYMDPEYLTDDSTSVQQKMQQGKIALTNLWASRAGAMDDEAESQVVGKVKMASAPIAMEGGKPATTIWWDGIVLAKNQSDEAAEAAFRVALEGMDQDMVTAEGNNDAAVWLIPGYTPGPLAQGVAQSASAGAPAYPSTTYMGLMHTAAGNNVADFLTGKKSAEETLKAIEADYTTAAKEAGIL